MNYLCDTCILIDYLRGREDIRSIFTEKRKNGMGMSSVTYMELMVGARNKQEIEIIRKSFADIEIVELTEAISRKGRHLIEQYSKSHGLLIPDALIGATALEYNIPLWTSNVSDFRFMQGISLV